MKIVLYRNKKTNKIVSYDDLAGRGTVTQEMIDKYNSNEKYDNYVEMVELKEDSIAFYFFNLKTQKIKDYYEDLRNLEEQLRDIANDIDDRLSEFEDLCEEQENEN